MHHSIGPNQNPPRKRQRNEKLKPIWEFVPAPDAEDRLILAYEMIFKDISLGEFTDTSDDPKPGEQQLLL